MANYEGLDGPRKCHCLKGPLSDAQLCPTFKFNGMCQGDTGQTRPLNKNLGPTQDGLRERLGSGNPNVYIR